MNNDNANTHQDKKTDIWIRFFIIAAIIILIGAGAMTAYRFLGKKEKEPEALSREFVVLMLKKDKEGMKSLASGRALEQIDKLTFPERPGMFSEKDITTPIYIESPQEKKIFYHFRSKKTEYTVGLMLKETEHGWKVTRLGVDKNKRLPIE